MIVLVLRIGNGSDTRILSKEWDDPNVLHASAVNFGEYWADGSSRTDDPPTHLMATIDVSCGNGFVSYDSATRTTYMVFDEEWGWADMAGFLETQGWNSRPLPGWLAETIGYHE